jgi:putative Holliday junction resolvase
VVIFDTPIEKRYERAVSLLGFDPRMLSAGGGACMSGRAAATTMRERSFIAFDFGLKRVGVASGNTVLGQASGAADDQRRRRRALCRHRTPAGRLAARRAGGGRALPPRRRRARQHAPRPRFARQLHGRFGLPVHEVDERYTTTEARPARPMPTRPPRPSS